MKAFCSRRGIVFVVVAQIIAVQVLYYARNVQYSYPPVDPELQLRAPAQGVSAAVVYKVEKVVVAIPDTPSSTPVPSPTPAASPEPVDPMPGVHMVYFYVNGSDPRVAGPRLKAGGPKSTWRCCFCWGLGVTPPKHPLLRPAVSRCVAPPPLSQP